MVLLPCDCQATSKYADFSKGTAGKTEKSSLNYFIGLHYRIQWGSRAYTFQQLSLTHKCIPSLLEDKLTWSVASGSKIDKILKISHVWQAVPPPNVTHSSIWIMVAAWYLNF